MSTAVQLKKRESQGGLHPPRVPMKMVMACAVVSVLSFYLGLMLGMQSCGNKSGVDSCPPGSNAKESETLTASFFRGKKTRFPHSMEKLFSGMARVNRDDFAKRFDLGVPLDPSTDGNSEVVIIYNHPKSLSNVSARGAAGGGDMPLLSVQDATIHCETLKIILTEPRRKGHCMAIMGQWESYHIHKYMRLPPDDVRTGLDPNLPLRKVARTYSNKGRTQIIPKTHVERRFNADVLSKYLASLADVLEELKPLAEKVAKDNTIVVLVCNLGQSELLMNFVCKSKALGLDVSQVLVFATDLETKALAEGLGLAAFYDATNFEAMPEQAARSYGDARFAGMMMAKVFCVHLVSQLGYNILFQDADLVWYRNPLEFFLDETSSIYDFDMYFQDDGAHSVRYAPYSPNTGFYFVRANDRTRYFFSTFVKMGEMIMQSGSHQGAITAILNEHNSYRGLKVKVFARDGDFFPGGDTSFPGGYHFHRDKDYMKKLFSGKVQPYVFHMSWTKNKENKRIFFEQMGDWHVRDHCPGKTARVLLEDQPAGTTVESTCCSADPIIRCHYRDKPSKIPCKDSPTIDKGRASFW